MIKKVSEFSEIVSRLIIDIIAAVIPVNTEPLGAPAYVYVSALHQRRNACAIFRRLYKTPSGSRNPSHASI